MLYGRQSLSPTDHGTYTFTVYAHAGTSCQAIVGLSDSNQGPSGLAGADEFQFFNICAGVLTQMCSHTAFPTTASIVDCGQAGACPDVPESAPGWYYLIVTHTHDPVGFNQMTYTLQVGNETALTCDDGIERYGGHGWSMQLWHPQLISGSVPQPYHPSVQK